MTTPSIISASCTASQDLEEYVSHMHTQKARKWNNIATETNPHQILELLSSKKIRATMPHVQEAYYSS
jgi:hypothetical protein